MSKMVTKKLTDQVEQFVLDFLKSFDTVLTDCDGVLWKLMTPYPKAAEVLNTFRDVGKKVFYITNNSTKTRQELVAKCRSLDFKAEESEVLCTANMTAQYLKDLNFKKKVFVIGTTGITKELDMAGISHCGVGPDVQDEKTPFSKVKLEKDIGAVIVGFDEHFSFPKLTKAANYLYDEDVLFLATNTDERFPANGSVKVTPGTGSLVRCVETAAERKAIVIGKPSTYTADMLKAHFNVNPDRTLMIGDRANTDILLGKRCGFLTLLVLSGVTSLKELDNWQSPNSQFKEYLPNYYVDSIGDLLPYLKKLQTEH